MQERINGTQFKQMILYGAASLTLHKQSINDLNVFPVPDGDTGTNMSMTLQTAAAELPALSSDSIGVVAQAVSSALLRGARGNSGVILSLLFRGISKILKGLDSADGVTFAAAMQEGVAAAYSAVMKPAEGTVLTVSRLSAKRAVEAAAERNSVEYVLSEALACCKEVLAQTTEMNPVLKRAGVVDAGGMGYSLLIEGMLHALQGLPMPQVPMETNRSRADFSSLAEEELSFTYDTVFTVRWDGARSLEPLRLYLSGIGDCLVIGEDDRCFKVHIHTDVPGSALTEAQKYGTLELAKIENMRTQRDDLAAGRQTASAEDLEDPPAQEEKEFGFLAVCAGEGLSAVFSDLGVDRIVNGGQTMNPSTEDILREIRRIPAKTVFVLPNNDNILMAARQCIALTEQEVIVIPSATVPQGISAMMSLEPEMTREEITQAMEDAILRVTTLQITYAARDSEFDGRSIREGDYLALWDKRLFATQSDLAQIAQELAGQAARQAPDFITVFYGKDVTEEMARALEDTFRQACPEADVSLISGGQPVYYYIIALE